ncbi:hypothetical protein Tco_0327029 [Tanacetum coccineum]
MTETMMKPTMEKYVIKARGDYYSGITKTMINGKDAYELKGKFLDDLRNNAFSETNREDAVEHIENFLKIIDPLELPKAFYDLEETYEDEEHEIAEIFRIEANIFDLETSLCTTFNEFNYLLKIDTNLFTHDIQGAKTYEERNDDEAIREEGKPNDDHGIGNFDNDLVGDNAPYHASKEEEQYEEDMCKLHGNHRQEPPVCKIGRFEVIKYSFRPAEKYIAIK